MVQLVKSLPAMRETWVDPWVGKSPWRREWLPTLVFWPGEFHGLFHWIAKSQTQLSNFHFHKKERLKGARVEPKRFEGSCRIPWSGIVTAELVRSGLYGLSF